MSKVGKKISFTSVEDELLIVEVKKFPNLYDGQITKHRDHEKTQQSWEAVAAALSKRSWKECKERWKYLRDRYAKVKRASASRNVDPAMQKRKWKHYDSLTFLCDHITHRPSESHLYSGHFERQPKIEPTTNHEIFSADRSPLLCAQPNNPPLDAVTSVEKEEGTDMDDLQPDEMASSFSSSSSSNEGDVRTGNKRRYDYEGSDEIQYQPRRKTQPEDDLSLFGRLVGITLQKLNRRNASLAKLKIQQVLCECEQKELDENSDAH